MTSQLIRSSTNRLRGALRLPSKSGWVRVLLECCWGLPLLGLVAALAGLIAPRSPPESETILALSVTLFFAPAFAEELLFRVLIIPPERSGLRHLLGSVVAFVAWHPLQAVTIGPPWAGAFLDPGFLACVAILGTLLARIYVATRSVWPCAVVHWIVVLVWKVVLGGPF
jgi:uncharacterized protein